MTRVVVLGGGIAGHTAALHLKRMLKRSDEVVVVTPNSKWNWIPSNIWVGVGRMKTEQVTFKLGPIYKRMGIDYRQALATAIHPEGGVSGSSPYVEISYTDPARDGETDAIEYDFLINATGPKLNFGATPGLGPDGFTRSVCTSNHAVQAAEALQASIEKMKGGERQVLVVGMGHGTCTCEGAAFEYAFNVEHEVRQAGVRDMADIVYLTNEYELGDFGVGGLTFTQQGFQTTSKLWTESLFRERGIRAAGDELHQVGKDSGLGEFFLGGIGEEEVHLAPFFQEEGGLGTDFRGIQAIDGAGRTADRDELLLDDGILRIPDAVLICGLR